MPFSLGSQSQRKEATENKTGVYRGETDNGRAGGAWIVSYCPYWNGLEAVKENALHLQSAQRPLCLQTQMVPLTLASLINLVFHRLLMESSYLLWASSYVLMEKQVVFCCLNPFHGSLVPLKWSWITYWDLQTIPHGPPIPLMNLWLHLLPTICSLLQSQWTSISSSTTSCSLSPLGLCILFSLLSTHFCLSTWLTFTHTLSKYEGKVMVAMLH